MLISACQAFSAPDGPVCSESGAVPNKAYHVSFQSVVGHTGSKVRMVMLHRKEGNLQVITYLEGIFARQIIRMQVAGNRLRYNIKEALKMADLFLIMLICLKILQIPDMLARKSVSAFRQTKACFLFCSAGQDRRKILPF